MKINKVKEITFTGMMIALCIVLRYLLSPLPNVKPITAIIILLSIFISPKISALTGSCVMLLTGFLLGFGIWIPFQIVGYLVISFISKYFINKSIISVAIWSGIACYIYGLITTVSMLVYVPLSSLFITWIGGLYFDSLHAASTVIFTVLLYKIFELYGKKINRWLKNK